MSGESAYPLFRVMVQFLEQSSPNQQNVKDTYVCHPEERVALRPPGICRNSSNERCQRVTEHFFPATYQDFDSDSNRESQSEVWMCGLRKGRYYVVWSL
jgi:hypothetical protein